jgi:ribokinase
VSIEVVAIGRINIDITMAVDKLPKQPGHVFSKSGYISMGGSAANFSMQCIRLGVRSGLVSCIGNDSFGEIAMRNLSDAGVDTKSVLILDKQQTGLFFMATDETGAKMVFAEQGANRFLEKHTLDEEYVTKARTIHVAGGFPMIANMAANIAENDGLVLSLDPGRAAESMDFPRLLRHTDLLFLNQRELKDYFNISPTENALTAFAKTIPGIVIVKLGEKGAIATDGFEYCTSEAFEVPVIDKLGSGDAFAAGFIVAWTRSERIQKALHMANAVAALTITQRGAQNGQPTLDETTQFMNEQGIRIDDITRTFREKRSYRSSRSA